MKKFQVEVSQRAYRSGFYELGAPDFEAAVVLAKDIALDDQRIKWDNQFYAQTGWPKEEDIYITEVKE